MKRKKKSYNVYLAGAMEKAPDGGVKWRRKATKLLKKYRVNVFDPTFEEDKVLSELCNTDLTSLRKMDKSSHAFKRVATAIWGRDMYMIAKTQILLVYLDEAVFQSSGTLCEMSHAHDRGIPVIAVYPEMDWNRIPLWTVACITFMVPDLKEATQIVGRLVGNDCSY